MMLDKLSEGVMAYLAPHFDFDAFISYSHGDPLGLGGSPLKQRTLALIQEIENEIRASDPEFAHINLWRDVQLDPTLHLTPSLRETVTASFILLIVMSKYYLSSLWCKDELEWFRAQISDRKRDQGRFFVIRAQPTDESLWPDFLKDERGHVLPGFQFHAPNAEIAFYFPKESDSERTQELMRLATTLIVRLRETKRRLDAEAAKPATLLDGPPEPAKLFLHASRARLPERDAIKAELERDGFNLVTMRFKAAIENDLGQDERKSQIRWLKQCDALALTTFDGG